jgi:hypothetical protein
MTTVSQKPLFDPRQVPVWQIDHDLPAVPSSILSPQALRARFLNPPVWQPVVVRESFYTKTVSNYTFMTDFKVGLLI